MKKYFLSAFYIVFLFLLLISKVLAAQAIGNNLNTIQGVTSFQTLSSLQIPAKPNNYVNDYADLLSLNTAQQLNNQLRQFEQQTSNQIVVAIFPSLKQENLEDFAVRLE